ncbi:MAG TPA: hypothetical protein ENH55_13355 [Aurantimonas coralicida]|uniref:Uncharacterized protein n=2 Tax=root TaxID=1 RepID=A0A9C9NED1_9HYPH|nr:hypothetical protein [Aurantimonas coralicida]HET99652.1 hypothetical protein [Aurantimonas coralicida]
MSFAVFLERLVERSAQLDRAQAAIEALDVGLKFEARTLAKRRADLDMREVIIKMREDSFFAREAKFANRLRRFNEVLDDFNDAA